MNRIVFADNLSVLRSLESSSVPLIYIDPPFNTGRVQSRTQIQTTRSEDGDRVGFSGRRYQTTKLATRSYDDIFDDFIAFIEPRLVEAHRVLAPNGTLYFHIDYREVHYCKVLLDTIFGRASFLNEIIWAYDYGARTNRRWPAKHDNILVYVKDPGNYVFNGDDVDREPYMAPGLVGPEKAAHGKLPTDCYAEGTELLTERGWVDFSCLALEDRVASVSPSRDIVYSRPTKLYAYHYEGPMIQFRAKSVDLLVTPKHQMYLRPKSKSAYSFVSADDLTCIYYALMNKLAFHGADQQSFSVPSIEYKRPGSAKPLPEFPMADWCEFMGWYIAEGSVSFYRDRAEVCIAQSKPQHLDRIHSLLSRMNIRFYYDNRSFIICNKQLAVYLKQFGHSHEKYIPRELLALSVPYLSRLYEGLMLSDGSIRRETEWLYHTVSKQLASDVQELIIKLGFASSIYTMNHDNHNWRMKYIVSRRLSKETTIFPEKHQQAVSYAGMVYCCTVEPYHTLIVRRNGRMAVCGNCWWHTIVPTNGKEKTGYPTQKPLGILKRIIRASSNPGDLVLDFFAGSGTTGIAAAELGRRFLLVDNNEEALITMSKRFADVTDVLIEGFDPTSSSDEEA